MSVTPRKAFVAAVESAAAASKTWYQTAKVDWSLTPLKISILRRSPPLTEIRYFILSDGRTLAFTAEEEKVILARLRPYLPSSEPTVMHHPALAAVIVQQLEKSGELSVWDFGTIYVRRAGNLQVSSARKNRPHNLGEFPTVDFLSAEYPELNPLSWSDIDF